MPLHHSHTPGTFCSFHLATPDLDVSGAFLGELFGWTRERVSGAHERLDEMVLGGQVVATMGPLDTAYQDAGHAPYWLSHVRVADFSKVIARIQAAGGEVMGPPAAVGTLGGAAMVRDPAGASFSLWRAASFIGVTQTGAPGTVAFVELASTDAAASAAFAEAVFGWTIDGDPASADFLPMQYDGVVVARLRQIAPGGMPSHLGPRILVDDLDATVARASTLGGRVARPPAPAADAGRVAIVVDGAGAPVYLVGQ